MTITIRGFLHGVKQFEDGPIEVNALDLDTLLPELAKKHAHAMAMGGLGMVEIDFHDGEFFRIGVDPTGMVMPVRVL